jgi:hypothetical protein
VNGDTVRVPRPAAVFQGYDSVNGQGLSTAVEGTTNRTGAISQVTYTVCTDIETLSQSLQVDQSLSVGYGSFGGVDEKSKFVRSLNVTTYSVSIVVYAKHVLGTVTATDFAQKPGITPPEGYFVMGFRGRSGGQLDAIGVIYGQLRPATWHPFPIT